MELPELQNLVQRGEDSRRQFKADIRNFDSLAAEMVAFSNGEGGRIFIGVTDSGKLVGVPRSEVGRLNQLIGNAASQHVRSPISPFTENILVEDKRVVIVPNTLTVEKIRLGNSIIRNPILVSHAAKGLLPYRGLGSGVPRALESWPDIEFLDDREGNQFKATLYRTHGRTDEAFLDRLKARPETTIAELAESMGMTPQSAEKRIARLKKEGRLRRTGPTRGGRWEVVGLRNSKRLGTGSDE